MDNFNIRNARPQDCPVIAELIRGLAHYEKLDDQCQVTLKNAFSETNPNVMP